MSNLRYKRLVEDFHKGDEESYFKWIVLSGKPIRKRGKSYLERNLVKTVSFISRKYFGKKILKG